MKIKLTRISVAVIVAIAMLTVFCTASAQAVEIDWPEPNWPEIFEPNQLLTLHLEMDPCDWHDVINNTPEPNGCILTDVELPAWFWMEGEEALKIRVAVRRKKAFAFPDENDPCKVALKIDINQYYPEHPNAATEWHGLKKLSLEVNIDAMDVISEGVACNLHQMASGPEGYIGFYANWVKFYVNDNYIGIYVNNEQRDKQFMKHRDMYVSHDSWLYKYADCEPDFVLRVGDDDNPRSPAVEALCYDPFVNRDIKYRPTGGVCPLPDDANVVADMNQWVNMQGMLTMAATDAFLANSGCLFDNSENTYFLDFNLADPCETRKRMYFPWDVDQGFKSIDRDIYYTTSSYEYKEVILGKPVFRSQYNQIMRDLLDGPLTFADINDFLDMVEPVITDAVEADPLAMAHIFDIWGASSAAECFDGLRSFFSQRIPNVLDQVAWDEPTPPPGIILLQDDFEGAVWDANWTHGASWLEDTGVYAHGLAAAKGDTSGTFTCVDLDASDATAIHIDFWCRKKGTESEDFTLFYYGNSGYNLAAELDGLGVDNEWLHYTDTITDSNYFVSNFKIQFDAGLGGGEDVWVDDVFITKEIPPVISGHILDPNDKPIDGVLVDANNAGGSDTTDIDGYYEVEVPKNWSGTVTPTKEDYTFEPANRAYSNVTADQTGQDYVGTSIYDLNEDGFIDFADLAMCIPAAWLSSQGDGNWDPVCDFYYDLTVNFKDFAKFGGAWKPE